MFGMLSVFAEFERAMVQERVKAGLLRARALGKTLGRPRLEVDAARVERTFAQGLSVRKTAALLKVTPSKVQRLLRERAAVAAAGGASG
jgi:DNA invertase Pin-like site-specific DNA recombinase